MPKLFLPPGVRYTCIRCGECCRSLEVTLTEAEHERLAAREWPSELPDYTPERFFARIPRPRGKQVWRLRPLPTGACRLLTDDGLCRVHAALGLEAKPFAGRLFPFTFTVTPIGVFVGVRFNCPAVVRGKGPELEHQRRDIERLFDEYARVYHPPCEPERVRFSGPFELGWRDIVRLEDQLVAFLLTRDLTLPHRLLACRRLVRRFVAEATGSDERERVGVEPDEVLADVSKGRPESPKLSSMEGALLRLLAATFLGATLPSFRELSLFGRAGVRLGNVGRRLRFALGRGRVGLPGVEAAVAVREVTGVEATLDATATAMLERYLVAKVASQGFFGGAFFGRSFVQGMDFLASAYGVIVWLAQAHALAAGRRRTDDGDVEYAIRQVDYGFSYVPALGSGLDRMRAFLFRHWGTQEKLLGGA